MLTQCPAYMIFRNELYTASSDINDVFIHMNESHKMCFILNDIPIYVDEVPKSAKQSYTIEELYYIPGKIIIHLNDFIIDCLLFMQCFHILKSLISLF